MRFRRFDGGPALGRLDSGGLRRRRPIAIAAVALAAGAAIAGAAVALPGGGSAGAAGGSGWSWYKADTHVHTAFSGDAAPDLGIVANGAKINNYNVLFITDHNLASTFPVSIQTAVDVHLDDTMPRWFPLSGGIPASVTNALAGAPAPVDQGATSLHLAASAETGQSGESAVWTKRGANLRSGDDVLSFAVHPKALGAGSGLYVSASIGGDPTVTTPPGYTTGSGVISPGLSKVFVYYLGAPPSASRYPGAQVFTFNLGSPAQIPGHFSCDRAGVVLNAWTHCTINLNRALPLIAADQQPLDYNAFSDLKIAAVASGGSADAYFDSYRLKATAPIPAGQEYVFRNGLIAQQDTPNFRMYPGVEMGVSDHTNRFDFGFSDPAAFRSYKNGVEGIAEAHAAGYPAQLDHPGVAGGVTDQEAIDNDAYGADMMETRFPNMIDDWDALLTKGVVLTGTWATDNHLGRWSAGSQATYIQAPSIAFDDLVRSLYEGRTYLATNGFAGRVILNPDPAATDPHAARYPIFVSDAQTTASAHLAITSGIAPGSTVAWITNGGTVLASEATTSTSYDAVKQVPITGQPLAYVRAELRDASGIQKAMSQPIIWKRAPGLPAGMSAGVEAVATPGGAGYTNASVKGASAAGYDAGRRVLSVTLENPAGSLVDLEAATAGAVPAGVTAGGAALPRAASLADHLAAAGPSWYHDAASGRLFARVLQGAGPTAAEIAFATPGGDAVAPSPPTNLVAIAGAPTRVDLRWDAATDAVGVAGYDVYRDGIAIARLGAAATSHVDATAVAGGRYRYAVDAFDAAGNRSTAAVAVVSTPAEPGTAPPDPTPIPTDPGPGTQEPHGGVAPTPPVSAASVIGGAFRQIASQPHGEGFRLTLSLRPARRTAGAGPASLPRLRTVVHGQTIVQDGRHARASLRMSGVRGRLSVVAFGGRLFASRGGVRYRLATGGLRAMLPPIVPSGLGQDPAGLARVLVRLRDLGTVRVGTGTTHRYRAALAPAALRRYLAGALVRAGMAPARAATLAAASRITLNRVDLDVSSGQLERERVWVRATIPAGRFGAGAGGVVSAEADVRLTDYGAELSVLRPRAAGTAETIGQLR